MTEVERLLDQLDRSFRGDAWHGPSLEDVLAGVSAEQAAARPIGSAHTIRELVDHLVTWQTVVRRRLAGEDVVPTGAENFPHAADESAVGWAAAVERLRASRAALRAAVVALDRSALDAEPVRGRGSRYLLVHGVIQHDLYHAGQIALLAKAARE